jgi:SAM-dependent methyltransferase
VLQFYEDRAGAYDLDSTFHPQLAAKLIQVSRATRGHASKGIHGQWLLSCMVAVLCCVCVPHHVICFCFCTLPAVAHQLAQPQPGEALLDLATGTGLVALAGAAAVGPGGRVLGVDLSPAMLQQVGSRLR